MCEIRMRGEVGNKKAGNAFGAAEAVPKPNLREYYRMTGGKLQQLFSGHFGSRRAMKNWSQAGRTISSCMQHPTSERLAHSLGERNRFLIGAGLTGSGRNGIEYQRQRTPPGSFGERAQSRSRWDRLLFSDLPATGRALAHRRKEAIHA